MQLDRSKWPKYFRQRLWVGDLDGDVGILTLWSPMERLIENFEKCKDRVAVVGQLYTARGIEYVIRNCYLNPKIRYLLYWGQDLSGSSQILTSSSQEISRLCPELPEEDVKKWLKEIEIIDLRAKTREELDQVIGKLPKKAKNGLKKKIFAESKPVGGEVPSEMSLFRVEGETIGEAWLQILKLILRFGAKIPRVHVYGGHERVVLNLAAVITGEDIANPKMWPFFDFDKDSLRRYFRNFFSPSRGDEAYTYGERLFAYEIGSEVIDQVSLMAKKLKSFEYNKGALAVLWQASIDNFGKRKPWRTPCLTLVQGICIKNKLYLTAYFRSNDMYGAWPQNAFALRKLQTELARKIGKGVGDLTIISHTAFIDESDLVVAERRVKDNERMFCRLDPRGYVVVEVEGEEVVARHFVGQGRMVAEYRQNGKEPKAAMKLASVLVKNQVISSVDHGLDIGEQLGRAEDAVKLKMKFEQDKALEVGM